MQLRLRIRQRVVIACLILAFASCAGGDGSVPPPDYAALFGPSSQMVSGRWT